MLRIARSCPVSTFATPNPEFDGRNSPFSWHPDRAGLSRASSRERPLLVSRDKRTGSREAPVPIHEQPQTARTCYSLPNEALSSATAVSRSIETRRCRVNCAYTLASGRRRSTERARRGQLARNASCAPPEVRRRSARGRRTRTNSRSLSLVLRSSRVAAYLYDTEPVFPPASTLPEFSSHARSSALRFPQQNRERGGWGGAAELVDRLSHYRRSSLSIWP